MISKIDRFKIYNQTLEQYKNNKAYQLPNGKPDIRKIKKEAVDRLISELIINQGEDAAQFPELLQEENRSIVRRWWNAITDFFRGMYKSANISIFEETAKQIIEGSVEGQVSDIVNGTIYAQRRAPYIKPGVQELFEINPELASVGTPEQYSAYLDSIFPESKIKDIVYHGSNKKFDVVDISKSKYQKGFYFAKNKSIAEGYGNTLALIVDSKNIQVKPFAHFGYNVDSKESLIEELFRINSLLQKGNFKNALALQFIDITNEIEFFKNIEEKEDFIKLNSGWENIEEDFLKNKVNELKNLIENINDQGEFDTMLTHDDSSQLSLYAVGKSEQTHILGNENDVQGFREFVETGASGEGIFFQLAEPTKAQKEVQRRILETEQALRKGAIDPETDVLTLGDSDATNFYEYKQPDGTYKRVLKRVTDRVKRYYKDRFGDTAFSKEEKAFNEFKRTLGVKYHGYFEEIHDRFFNKDGTRKANPEPRPDIRDQVDAEVYSKLEKYYTALIESRSKGGKNILVFSEVRVYDPREQEAGTIDLLIVDEDGTGNIFDWKFMSVAEGQKDVQWYKQEAYNIQLKRYRDMLLANYGVKKIGMNRAVPILFQIKPLDKRVEGSKPTLTGINVGSVDTTKIEDLRLVPISEKTESTGFESLDKFIKQLNSVLDKISSRNASSDEQREFKRERLTIVREAIRAAQGTMNIKPVIDVMLVMMKEGENLINDYNVIYKNANAQSNEFTNKQLSDFSSELRDFVAISEVFGRIGENIGKLIYSKDMDTTNMSEEEISGRKELLKDVEEKAKEIIQSRQEVFDIAGKFADKYMGLRNLVSGLLNPEAVVKGLGSFFRTVSEIPLRSVQILYKLTENAKSRASADAKVEVDELMKIREKLAARGGDLRALVKKIYRKDDKGNFVNKLIYKYSTEFGDGVRDNALEENRSKQWLKENIDIAAYSKEANALLEKIINQKNKDYANNEELRDRLILQEKQKWDITRADFNGWSNYVILRHPLPKWLSEEYKELQKDQDLLDLYNFITGINDKAADAGYLTNQGVSTFLPWVRKSMAESLAWDFSLSTVMNFGKKLSLRADDIGRGKIDSLTNEIENGIPKYYTTDFTRLPGGEVDTSEVSEDLFANMVLYIGHMNNYKYLFEVEGQIELIKTIETFKEHLETANNGNVVIRNGVVNPQSGNEENTKIYDQFMRAVLYDQKYALDDTDVTLSTGPAQYVKKTVNKVAKHFGGKEVFEVSDEPGSISLVKSMETMNRYFQLKALGLEFVSGAVNWFGTNVQLAAQSGNYFTRGEVATKQYKILKNKLNKNEQDIFMSLVDTFMPLREDPNYENFKKAGMSQLTKQDFGDILMFFMRSPEQFTEKAVFMTLLDNIMVQDGRFENIRNVVRMKYADQRKGASAFQLREIDKQIENDVNQLKKEKSIGSTVKMEDGKLVIPGFDLSNRNEIQRLTKLTREISTNATGGINSANTNRAQMNIWFKSAMVFKSWIPGLAFTRFDHLRKISDDFSVRINEDGTTEGERYDIGRLRLFAYVLGTTITQQSNNILNIINLNDKGLIEIDRMFEKFGEEYFQRTGQSLNMTREEFIDLIRTNLRNQLSEFTLTLSLMGLALSMGMLAPDDDEDKATKNLFRYSQRVVDKFVSELTFFINPVEFQGILEGNLIPAIGVVTDATRFVDHFTRQVTGFDISDPTKSFEDVQKDAQPIKNLAKMFPVSKSLVNYLAMFDEEFAKEYDITIPKTAPK
jgi:KaiC/GvpD/RAD55 family RecA-like ATPase